MTTSRPRGTGLVKPVVAAPAGGAEGPLPGMETFSRTVDPGWGTSEWPTGLPWDTWSGLTANAVVEDGIGVLRPTSPAGSGFSVRQAVNEYQLLSYPVNVLARIRFLGVTPFEEMYAELYFQDESSGAEIGVAARLDGALETAVFAFKDGFPGFTSSAEHFMGRLAPGDWFYLRGLLTADQVWAKAWSEAADEPAAWDISILTGPINPPNIVSFFGSADMNGADTPRVEVDWISLTGAGPPAGVGAMPVVMRGATNTRP